MPLEDYKTKFTQIRVNRRGGRNSPHKICMLLSVLDMAESGALTKNKILYSESSLLDRYQQYFNGVRTEGDNPNPYMPFFHLQGKLTTNEKSFWHLQPIDNQAVVLDQMRTATSHKDITNNVAFAFLDEKLFTLLQNTNNIEILRNTLTDHWFDRGYEELSRIISQGKQISHYEHRLRDILDGNENNNEGLSAAVRDPAFRRVVTEMYDYRCAATGLRIILPNGSAMVEAAHIRPFSETRDDDPRNGLALTPDMHWAMDKRLIAPTTDYKWKVSAELDERIPDYRVLTELEGKSLFLPAEQRTWPKQESLEWAAHQLISN